MAGTENKSTYWSPSRNYELSCKVGKFDLTNDLIQMNMLSSVELPYRTYVLDFFLDPDDMILERIYGQEPIQLKIKVYGTSENIPHELIEANLMALGSKYDLLMKDTNPQLPDKIRSSIRIRCVPLEAYKTMTAFVNGVYLNSTLREIVTDLVSQTGAQLLMDGINENTEKIDQIIVPPSPLFKALKYLNRTFGFFNGLASITSSSIKIHRRSNSAILSEIPTNVYIKNLSTSHRFANTIITQLSTNAKQEDLLYKFDGKNYYTYNPIATEYTGNTAFSQYGTTMKHVVKPRDRLFKTISIDTATFAERYGITTGEIKRKNEMFFSKNSQEKRISFFKDHTGYDDSETFIRANHTKHFAHMSILKIELEKWLLLKNLIDVGNGVIFRSNIIDIRDLTGNYVMKYSLVHFIRASRDWECGVSLHLIRTNRIK